MQYRTDTLAKATLAQYGMTMRRQDGEYRVTIKGHPRAEALAYYTDDRDDAVNTGIAMAKASML